MKLWYLQAFEQTETCRYAKQLIMVDIMTIYIHTMLLVNSNRLTVRIIRSSTTTTWTLVLPNVSYENYSSCKSLDRWAHFIVLFTSWQLDPTCYPRVVAIFNLGGHQNQNIQSGHELEVQQIKSSNVVYHVLCVCCMSRTTTTATNYWHYFGCCVC